MDLHADCVAAVCNAGYTADGGDLVVCLEYALFAVSYHSAGGAVRQVE